MNRRLLITGLTAAALGLGVGSCEEITTRTRSTTLTAEIDVTGSSFVDAGDHLVGDKVRFTARVTEGGEEISSGDYTFDSDDDSVVRIDDPATGEATFVGVGTTPVRVTIGEPAFEGSSEQLGASMSVTVQTFTVGLTLTSTLTETEVDPANALVGDVLRVDATVLKGVQSVSSSISSIVSDDTGVIDPAGAAGADQVAVVGAGPVNLTIRFASPDVPGDEPLTRQLAVTVKEFTQEMNAVSLVSNHLANGDTLVTDRVALRATVVRGMTDTLKNSTSDGTVWTSSNPSIVSIEDDTIGVFGPDTGTVVLSVSFTDLDLPGEPFPDTVRVTTFEPSLQLVSLIPGSDHLANGDTLLSDSVQVQPTVIATRDGTPRASAVAVVESSDSARVLPVDNTVAADEVVFADTGAATLQVTLSQPTLPQATLTASLPLRVATYLAAISPTAPTPIMGDTIDYDVAITYTRDNSPVSNPQVTFSSTDPSVIQLLNAGTGSALMRDVGQTRVAVVSNDPSLPAAIVSDTSDATNISVERFYGSFSDTTGTFGQMQATPPGGDTVIVQIDPSSNVHRFTDSTRVEFPNGRLGFVAGTQPTQLIWLVPAGADTGTLVLRNLADDQGGFRDNVPIRFEFDGPGTAVVDDFFEDNDTMPLALKDSIFFDVGTPFEALLAIDHTKAAPADTNFFYFRIDLAATVDIVAEWQVDADVDFKICPAEGGPPPTGYGDVCTRAAGANSTDPRREEATNLLVGIGRHVLAFYCNSASPNPCPADFPLTYKVSIIQQ